MNLSELRIAADLAVSNMTSARLDKIYESMTYDSKQELVNAIRNYVTESHTKDEVQTKAERLKAAIMSPVFQFEEAEILK